MKGPAISTLSRMEWYLSLLVPVFSFGGIVLAVALENLRIIPDAGLFYWGCVIGAMLLGYLAYIKPRRDIVSLCVPVFAIIIFLVPMEYTPTLLLQVLFAVSMTLLVVRLNLRFSLPPDTQLTVAESWYHDYAARLGPLAASSDPESSRKLARIFTLFRSGEYEQAIAACDDALGRFDNSRLPIDKALAIISEQLEYMKKSLEAPETYTVFSDDEQEYLAFHGTDGSMIAGPEMVLDNALILIYAAASSSPEGKCGLGENDYQLLLSLIGPYLAVPAATK